MEPNQTIPRISKSYKAIMSQVSTGAPTVTVIQNDFSPTYIFTWTRTSAGLYTVTITSDTVFVNLLIASKTLITLPNTHGDTLIGSEVGGPTIARIRQTDITQTPVDGLSYQGIHIQVYE